MKKPKYWSPDTFEISSFKFGLKERINKTYNTSGGDNTGKCKYTYNELGYRGDSVNKLGFRVMSIGCSFTEGVGVNDNETWPFQFCKLISNGVNMNFGTGGRSNDFIARCLLSYYDYIKPDLVLIMYTNLFRREVYTQNNSIEPFIPTHVWGFLDGTHEGQIIQKNLVELQNTNEDLINWYKNHLLIKYFLESKKCNWLWNGTFGVPKDYVELNRFDGEYAKFVDKGVDGSHPGPIHNSKYAIELFTYIIENFPDFLSTKSDFVQKLI